MAKPRKGGDYPVGKYKPPVANQFKKGQSGNYKGRPKNHPLFINAIYEKYGKMLVPIKIGGETKKMPMMEAIIANQFFAALKNPKYLPDLLKSIRVLYGEQPPTLEQLDRMIAQIQAELGKDEPDKPEEKE